MKWAQIGCGGLIGLVVLVIVLGSVFSSNNNDQTSAPSEGRESTRPTATVKPTPKPTPTVRPTPTFEELKSEAARLSYDDLFRNNERHIGKMVWYEAEVIQVADGSIGTFVLRANVTRGQYFWDDTVYLRYSGPRLLEEDIIEFVGVIEGLKTYEAIFGNSVTIPEIRVLASKLAE